MSLCVYCKGAKQDCVISAAGTSSMGAARWAPFWQSLQALGHRPGITISRRKSLLIRKMNQTRASDYCSISSV